MFVVRPVRAAAPRYPLGPATVAVLVASAAALGCGSAAGDIGFAVGVDESPGLDCSEVLAIAGEAATDHEWELIESGRPVWNPQVVHLGDADVYAKGTLEALLVASDDPEVHGAWAEWSPISCPLVAYAGACDEAHCGEEVDAPCAHLIQVPCPWTDDWAIIESGTQQLLNHLE